MLCAVTCPSAIFILTSSIYLRPLYTYVLRIVTSSIYLRPLHTYVFYIPKKVVWCSSVWTLADCEWRAAAKGLKPLRLPRASSICHLYTPYPINLHTHHRHLPALERLQKMSLQVGLAVLAQEAVLVQDCTCMRMVAGKCACVSEYMYMYEGTKPYLCVYAHLLFTNMYMCINNAE